MRLPRPVSCESLDSTHRGCLYQAVRNVLATDVALTSFAQIIDGLPTADTYRDKRACYLSGDHPLSAHTDLCPGARERAEEVIAALEPGSLTFYTPLLEAYQAAKPSTRPFHLRLIEMVAVAIHQIAVRIHAHESKLHDPTTTHGKGIRGVMSFACLTGWGEPIQMPRGPFIQPGFDACEQYPNGEADMVAYWAENRILGGVVLLDRSQDWTGAAAPPEPNVYLECCRRDAICRICQLLDEQQQTLVDFLLQPPRAVVAAGAAGQGDETAASADNSATHPARCPLPILPDRRNLSVRINPMDTITDHKVYRDIWERVVIPREERSVPRTLEFSTWDERANSVVV